MAGGSFDGRLVNTRLTIGDIKFEDITLKEIILGESLLTPGLQIAITLQSFVYTELPKDWKSYKNQPLTLNMQTVDGDRYLDINQQKIYRIDERELDINIGQNETLTIHACDQSLLNDAKTLVSKSWKCTQPSDIVNEILQSCAGVPETLMDVQEAGPARDYIAENIHPFQVIAQQCNVALDGSDPSFLHYMTFEDGQGMHHFRSLKSLMADTSLYEFHHSEGETDLANPYAIISFSFPCDFDLLTDLMNGIDENGQNINTVSTLNPVSGIMNLLGFANPGGCGVGGGNHKSAITNKGTSQQQNSCDLGVEDYLLKRQARMALLDKDKVSLRLTIPWNPFIHVGQSLNFYWFNKNEKAVKEDIYGTGKYMVVSLKHNIQFGGYGTTTLDCILPVL
jgi:hypothetical protein